MGKARKSDETKSTVGLDRRGLLKAGVAGAAAVTTLAAGVRPASAAQDPYAEPAKPALPPSNMALNIKRAALVVTDPQVDFLSPKGVTWGVVGESVNQHNTVLAFESGSYRAHLRARRIITVKTRFGKIIWSCCIRIFHLEDLDPVPVGKMHGIACSGAFFQPCTPSKVDYHDPLASGYTLAYFFVSHLVDRSVYHLIFEHMVQFAVGRENRNCLFAAHGQRNFGKFQTDRTGTRHGSTAEKDGLYNCAS